MPRVLIAGGGISGLTIAYRLQQLNPLIDVVVWEAGSRLGGNVWTEHAANFVIEHGPNGFLDNKPATLGLAKELGLADRLICASEAARKHRYLFLHGELQEMPGTLRALLSTSLLSWRGKLRLLAEPLIDRGNSRQESVAAFATRRFGREAADIFIDALVTGIYGGDPGLLDVRAAFPRMTALEAKFGSVVRGMLKGRGQPQRMWSFRTGLSEMIEALANRLIRKPILGANVQGLERTSSHWIIHGLAMKCENIDAVVLACPAHVQASIVKTIDTQLAAKVGEIPYNRIAVVAISFRESDIPKKGDGFGYIAPQRTRRDLLGVQWCSSIYPDRAPSGLVLWRALFGGWHRGEVADWPDDRLMSAVRAELRLAHGITADPVFAKIIRWPQAIPQYMLCHPERVAAIERMAQNHPGLFLAGNALHGVAMNDCVGNAPRVAKRVADYVKTGSANSLRK